MANVALAVEKGVKSHPGRSALVEWDSRGRERALTYGELGRRAAALAAALAGAGIGRGDRVLLLVPMSLDLYVSILGIIRMGAVCVFVDPHMGARRFDACCRSVAPKAFIGIPKGHLFRLFCPSLREVPLKIATGGLPGFIARDLRAFMRGRLSGTAFPEPADMQPADPALISFTTGSSGDPKGSNRTHGFLEGQLEALDAPEKARCPSNFPGFPILPLEDLARGRTAYLPRFKPGKVREADPATLLDQLERYKPAMMSGSPAYLEALADGAIRRGSTVDSVELLYTGGAPITSRALEKLGRVWRKASIQVVYGSTEAEPVATLEAREASGDCRELSKRGMGCCVGYPVPAIRLLILPLDHRAHEAADLSHEALPAGGVGEVVVLGPHVNTGYWNHPEGERANKIKTPQGIWHRMGDAGYLDAQGRLWVVGRTHTAMPNPWHGPAGKTAGPEARIRWPWIFPYQAELVADAFPEVRKSAYLEIRGRFYLVVERRPGRGGGDLEARLRRALHFLPLEDVVFHPSLPVDPRHNSKVEYAKVKARLEKGLRP